MKKITLASISICMILGLITNITCSNYSDSDSDSELYYQSFDNSLYNSNKHNNHYKKRQYNKENYYHKASTFFADQKFNKKLQDAQARNSKKIDSSTEKNNINIIPTGVDSINKK
jgi:hypothetical protein